MPEPFGHALIHVRDRKLTVDAAALSCLQRWVSPSNRAFTMCIQGNAPDVYPFLNALCSDEFHHYHGQGVDSIDLYPFPFLMNRTDVFAFDMTSLHSSNLYTTDLANRFCSAVCNCIVLYVPFSTDVHSYDDCFHAYLSPFRDLREKSLLVLHYNVPPRQCDWTFEKTTQRFLSSLSSSSSALLREFDTVHIVDIPCHKRKALSPAPSASLPPRLLTVPPAARLEVEGVKPSVHGEMKSVATPENTNSFERWTTPENTRSFESTENVFLHQAVLALHSLLESPATSLPGSFQLLLRLPFILNHINTSPVFSEDTVKHSILASLAIPSDSIRRFLDTLWHAVVPPPVLSFSHPVFRDDFYLRFYNRLRLAEALFVRFVASFYRHSAFRALSPAALRGTLHNVHKVMKCELEGFFPCTASLAVRTDTGEGGIARVFDRSAYRNEAQTQLSGWCEAVTRSVWVPCVRPQSQHDHHESAYVTDYTKWLMQHHDHYTWSGKYRRPGVCVMEEEELRQCVVEAVEMTEETFASQLAGLARESTTARQRVVCCEEREVRAIHTADRFALFVPFCRSCWKCISSLPARSQEARHGSEEDAVCFSRLEAGWFQEAVYLVRCAECERREAPSGTLHFAALPTAFAIDGVPSLFLSSLQRDQLCPLCDCLLHYSRTKEREAEPPKPEWSIRIPLSERGVMASRFRSVLRDMDRQVAVVSFSKRVA